jgi:hypothetical protein
VKGRFDRARHDFESISREKGEPMKILRRKLLPILAACLLAGCASFEPAFRTQDLMRARQPTVVQTQDGLEISVEEFASPHKSRQAFDAEVAAYGVLPLLVRLENKSSESFTVLAKQFRATLGDQNLELLYGAEAANQAATSEYAGKALGWTVATGPFAIVLWPVTIAGSAAHTQSVNNRIRQHFSSLELTDALLRPNQSAAGFVYFKVPAGIKNIERLTLTTTASAEKPAKTLSYTFSFPTLDMSSTPSTAR